MIALFCFALSYLVMPFMGTDLGKLMKMQRLSEEKIQYLVYQMLKGLKVLRSCIIYLLIAICFWLLKLLCFIQYIHSSGIIHRVS